MTPPFREILRRLQQSRLLPLIILPAIIIAFAFLVLGLHPINIFGLTQDDSIYFSSAQALSEGRGYILPSLPGTPDATKYPILYPLILSAVWKFDSSFPGNIMWGVVLNLALGAVFICLCYLFCRRCLGQRRLQSLLVAAYCGLHALTVFYSALLMSDMLFVSLVLGVFLLIATRLPAGWQVNALGAGLLCGLACLCRTAGIPMACGILLYLAWDRRWKGALAFLAGLLPALAANLLLLRNAATNPPVGFSAQFPGWAQTWYYYTSYGKFRALDSPSFSLKFTFLLNQILYLVAAVPRYLLSPLGDANIVFWLISTFAIALAAVAGIIRLCRVPTARSVCAVLVCYVAVLLAWDFPAWDRFLLPFLPFFVAAIATQVATWAVDVWQFLKGTHDWLSRSLAAALLLFMTVLLICTVFNFLRTSRTGLIELSKERGELNHERMQAFDWIRAHTRPDELVVANDDVVTFLYTGRQSITPLSPLPADLYDARVLHDDLAHFWDTAHVLGASYWLTDDDEQVRGLRGLRPAFLARIRESQSALPVAFQTGGRRGVQLHELRCVRRPEEPSCAAAAPVLFPAHNGQGKAVSERPSVHNK